MALPTVTIIGTVKFMETKMLQSGKQVTSLTVSCSEKKKDGTYDNLNIKADFWEKSAEFVNNFFNDGDPIIVTGKLITNSYEVNGAKKYEIKFHFPQASFVPKPQQSNNAQTNQGYQQQGQGYQPQQQQYQPQQQNSQQSYQQPPIEYQNAQGQPMQAPQQGYAQQGQQQGYQQQKELPSQ